MRFMEASGSLVVERGRKRRCAGKRLKNQREQKPDRPIVSKRVRNGDKENTQRQGKNRGGTRALIHSEIQEESEELI